MNALFLQLTVIFAAINTNETALQREENKDGEIEDEGGGMRMMKMEG